MEKKKKNSSYEDMWIPVGCCHCRIGPSFLFFFTIPSVVFGTSKASVKERTSCIIPCQEVLLQHATGLSLLPKPSVILFLDILQKVISLTLQTPDHLCYWERFPAQTTPKPGSLQPKGHADLHPAGPQAGLHPGHSPFVACPSW